MAARKRSSTQSKLLNRAVKAGRSALRQAQRRLPPDVRKQIERMTKEQANPPGDLDPAAELRSGKKLEDSGQRAAA